MLRMRSYLARSQPSSRRQTAANMISDPSEVAGLPRDATALPTLEGSRIRLRMLADGDIPALFEIFGDPRVTRYWGVPPLTNLADAHALFADIQAKFQARTNLQWGIARRADDAVIGTCSLYRPDFAHRRSELGFALAHAYWRQGFASEAIDLALGYAFAVLRFHRIEADVDPRNDASLRTLKRVGFRQEGYLRERYHLNGETQDSVYLGLLRTEWRPSAT